MPQHIIDKKLQDLACPVSLFVPITHRISFADFESLRGTDSNLFHTLLNATKAEPGGKVVVVDSADIKGESFQLRWKQWVERNPSAVLSTTTEQSELWEAEQAAAKLEADKAHVLKHANEAAARYFQYWVGQRGLLDTQRTRNAIFDEMQKRQKRDGAIPSAPLLDIVIEFLNTQGVFEWKSAEPVPAPAEPPPPKVLLADGSEQLPLGTTPSTRHSLAQLKDLDRRESEARNAAVRAANSAVAAAFRNAAAVSEITL